MLFPRRLAVAAASAVLLAAAAGCDGGGDPNSTPSRTQSASSASPSTTSSSPTSSQSPTPTTSSTPAEAPAQEAQRLALAQVTAYYAVGDRLYANPDEPIDVLDDFARDQALAEVTDAIKTRRDRGERIELTSTILRSWLGEDGVVFHKKAPQAVVDLYVCYDIGDAQVVDADGNRTPLVGPGVPQVAQARYAVYADQWPNDDPAAWRIGKEFAAGEPCQQ